MRKALLLTAAVLALTAGQALAAKKQLVIVVKGLDNPFFEAINQGCQKWNKENASSEYECFYTGPASTSDEAGEAPVVGMTNDRIFTGMSFTVSGQVAHCAGCGVATNEI